jgi:hypothetical protein
LIEAGLVTVDGGYGTVEMEREGDREGAFLVLDDLMDEMVLPLEELLTQYC